MKGVDDYVQDGNQTYGVIFGSVMTDDGNFYGSALQNLVFTNLDNDVAGEGIVYYNNETTAQTSKDGASDIFGITIYTQPGMYICTLH